MTVRVCLEPGCPTLTRRTRCADHERAKDKARGTRQERGYGADHEARRAEWAPIVAQGGVQCWRCREVLDPALPWHLGHDDHDRTKYRGPECVPCNTATAGRSA
ncbi:endonuclease domain-containing protein [Nocardioides sp. cx-169]|uniref:endonuclease domain-containing protein n=1 Tax=Nocardioides sp. cx-169 TaxID=2899080 RepID=UPI0035A8F232